MWEQSETSASLFLCFSDVDVKRNDTSSITKTFLNYPSSMMKGSPTLSVRQKEHLLLG